MTRPYHLSVIKKISTKTDAELAELKAKYKDGVPQEVVDHLASKLTDVVLDIDNEPRLRESNDAYRREGQNDHQG